MCCLFFSVQSSLDRDWGGHKYRYRDAGSEVLAVLCQWSPLVERASVDEAYLDLTDVLANVALPTDAALLPNTHLGGVNQESRGESVVLLCSMKKGTSCAMLNPLSFFPFGTNCPVNLSGFSICILLGSSSRSIECLLLKVRVQNKISKDNRQFDPKARVH